MEFSSGNSLSQAPPLNWDDNLKVSSLRHFSHSEDWKIESIFAKQETLVCVGLNLLYHCNTLQNCTTTEEEHPGSKRLRENIPKFFIVLYSGKWASALTLSPNIFPKLFGNLESLCGLCEHVIVQTILPLSPVILRTSLGGKQKWLLLKFWYHVKCAQAPFTLLPPVSARQLLHNSDDTWTGIFDEQNDVTDLNCEALSKERKYFQLKAP